MEIYIPESSAGRGADYVAVAAHKDDVEMMAFDGIVKGISGAGFAAAVLTDGGACPRAAGMEWVADEDMAQLRTAEQKRASETGCYSALALMERSSREVKDLDASLIGEISDFLKRYPHCDTLYVHNPFDKHPTHVGACLCALAAVVMLPENVHPKRILGCEVWRGLDWLPDSSKVTLDVSGNRELFDTLMSSFATQNAAKRYDIAASARRMANATYAESHGRDEMEECIYAIDITDVVKNTFVRKRAADDTAAVIGYLRSELTVRLNCELRAFKDDVYDKLGAR